MKVQLIKGGIFEDSRGKVSFVNDFTFDSISRFYIIENSEDFSVRAWQGHKIDCKNFYCIAGSFKIAYVEIDNWENPSCNLKVETVVLNAHESQILKIPAGFANAIVALEKGARLLSFSTLPLSQIVDDDVRYDKNTWNVK